MSTSAARAPEGASAPSGGAAPSTPTLYIEGPSFWAPSLPGWDVARAALRGEGALVDPPAKRPAPQLLAPAERRRAPDTVALALEVATATVAASGRDAKELPCVFASAHGDLGINDYMCSTLASDPTLLSPTKFHNSVHNAAAGYWTIGTGCMAASNSLTAYEASFAAGLLEAATQCAADQRAVLLVGFDVPAVGALSSVTTSRGLLAVAFVVAPTRTERTVASFDWSLHSGPVQSPMLQSEAARTLQVNAIADALPLFEALAANNPLPLLMPLAPTLSLRVALHQHTD
ncbi:beta-ketoacyl synthase chain length factor [Variovorax sp. RT4R15]|uniref:beta-ketoacyl synthase chain length factor n=1 Tax=Variovorax sp. RT4R15 TaxID=3443737 RepID=UPI003F4799A5